jgi:hypothetical protein
VPVFIATAVTINRGIIPSVQTQLLFIKYNQLHVSENMYIHGQADRKIKRKCSQFLFIFAISGIRVNRSEGFSFVAISMLPDSDRYR